MADPKWEEHLTPVLGEAVRLLADLVRGSLLDEIRAKRIIEQDQYDDLLRLKETKINADVARAAFQILCRKASPSFNDFCAVLGRTGGSGEALHKLLSRDTPPTHSTAAIDQCRTDPSGSALNLSRQIIFIEVVENLQKTYEWHETEIKAALVKYLKDVYPGAKVIFEEIFSSQLRRRQPPSETFTIDSRVKIRILFPTSDCACFELNRQKIIIYLCRLMQVKESDLEIDAATGSITLTVHLPGEGFLTMLLSLQRKAEPLQFLLDVDESARIGFGNFPYISVSLFNKREQNIRLPALLSAILRKHSGDVKRLKVTPEIRQGIKKQVKADILRKSLFAAIRKGDLERVKECVKNGAKLNEDWKESGKTPLGMALLVGNERTILFLLKEASFVSEADTKNAFMTAVETELLEVVRKLCQSKFACNYFRTICEYCLDRMSDAPSKGDALLFVACLKDNVKIAKLLIDAGADANARLWHCCSIHFTNLNFGDFDRESPLLLASSKGSMKITELLIDAGADANQTNSLGESPLSLACGAGHVEVAKFLIDAGSRARKTPPDKKHSLLLACSRGYLEIAKLLIDAGADVNQTNSLGESPLSLACAARHVEVAKFLIDAGASARKTFPDKEHLLLLACSRGYLEIAKLLIDAGANVNQTNLQGESPLLLACAAGHVEVAKFLIDAGANAIREKGLLLSACFKGYLDIARLLIDAGADVNQANSQGESPLSLACRAGHVEDAKFLIDAGANARETLPWGKRPFFSARFKVYLEIVRLLIVAGADVNQANLQGKSPLSSACGSGRVEVAIGAEANARKTLPKGKSPLLLACSGGYLETVRLLIVAGADINRQTRTEEV